MTRAPVQRVQLLGLILLGLAVVAAALLGDRAMVLGVLVGGLLASANFYALRRLVAALLQGGRPRRLALLGTLLTLKFGLLALSLYLIIRFLPVNAIGLLAGISVMVLAIFVEGFRSARHESSHERA